MIPRFFSSSVITFIIYVKVSVSINGNVISSSSPTMMLKGLIFHSIAYPFSRTFSAANGYGAAKHRPIITQSLDKVEIYRTFSERSNVSGTGYFILKLDSRYGTSTQNCSRLVEVPPNFRYKFYFFSSLGQSNWLLFP